MRITALKDLTPRIRWLKLQNEGSETFTFRAGQFVDLQVPQGEGARLSSGPIPWLPVKKIRILLSFFSAMFPKQSLPLYMGLQGRGSAQLYRPFWPSFF